MPSPIAASVFYILSILLFPVTLVGYVIWAGKALLTARGSGVSGTAQGPLSARWFEHNLGTREDEAANRLMMVVPGGVRLVAGPTLLAHRVTGAAVVVRPLTHESIQGGMQGMMFPVYLVPPTLSLALVGWAVASRRFSRGPRLAAMVAAFLLGCAVWTLARTNGILGGVADLEWRRTPTAEERLLAQAGNNDPLDAARGGPLDVARNLPAAVPAPAVEAPKELPAGTTARAAAPAGAAIEPAAEAERVAAPTMSERGFKRVEWPGFRGPERDGIVRGVRINTDWSASPPLEMWRRPIGPGWSSFAVSGDLLYTQEQRGDDEIVTCYKVSTGEPVWRHRDPTRFWESNGGPGPRGTPTLSNGRVYAFGATGILNALDATTGRVVWSRNVSTDANRRVPDWGFASSPLVLDDVVIVAAAGTLVGYDLATGNRRWIGPSYGGSYSSPHRGSSSVARP